MERYLSCGVGRIWRPIEYGESMECKIISKFLFFHSMPLLKNREYLRSNRVDLERFSCIVLKIHV
jgi:hypothetical protein